MENIQITKDKLKQIPRLPGIYKMIDSRGNIIYIGKSKCLQKRVQSYFVSTPKWEKVNRMVSLIKEIEYIVTDTHLEARLLECKLIKELKPYFNAQLKNDQRYFFIRIDDYNRYHPLSITSDRTENSFGPFRGKYTVSEFMDKLKNLYPITKCNGRYVLDYHIFPIEMKEDMFHQNRAVLLELFTGEGNIGELITELQTKQEEAASSYRYEIASVYRDLIRGFHILKNGLDGYKALVSKRLLLILPIDKGYKLFLVTGGSVVHSKVCSTITEEVKEQFIREGMERFPDTKNYLENEKIWIDYRDIIYSEISDLPKDQVEIIM